MAQSQDEELQTVQEIGHMCVMDENDAGTVRVTTEAIRMDEEVHETRLEEVMRDGSWRTVHNNKRSYPISSNGRLKGPESWPGTGEKYQDWFKQRHKRLFKKRFPNSSI